MLKPQLHQSQHVPCPMLLHSSLTSTHQASTFTTQLAPALRRRKHKSGRICCSSTNIRAKDDTKASTTSISAVVTVKSTVGGVLSDISVTRGLDDIADLLGKTLLLELVSSGIDESTGLEKKPVEAFAHRSRLTHENGEVKYEANFMITEHFGEVGGIFVTNEHHKEMFLKDIVLSGFANGPATFTCNSWVHAKSDNPEKRIFFANKSYLPSRTPVGLRRLREKELETLRGDGQGQRKTFERIYDYDTYNDLGDPDKSDELKRPVLGGKEHPYPRRCRTGRSRSKKDPLSEERSSSIYVPRDEAFSEVKQLSFSAKTLRSVMHALVPSIETALVDTKLGFPFFKDIDELFNEGLTLPKAKEIGFFQVLPRLVKALKDGGDEILLFETPQMIERDAFSWFRDEEFARQTLAGINPVSIQLVTEFPFVSKLDPQVNAGGIIERSFSPKDYSIVLSSDAYDQLWRFDMEALPGDLIRRGMAVEDPTAEHGLRLTIKDYPYANDGLLIWSALKQWVSDYVTHYYRDPAEVSADSELQAWWTEIRTKGHGDKKDEPWWPTLETTDDLIQIITTIIWVASCHHAAVNFGQYTYGGYFPNRPTIARINMPVEDEAGQDFKRFWNKPELYFLETLPSQIQATTVMSILDVLSNHSPDEEYIGAQPEASWAENPIIDAAFTQFSGKLKEIEGVIEARNADKSLKNRTGAGVVPYELLKPYSEPGVTTKGVPNSISI